MPEILKKIVEKVEALIRIVFLLGALGLGVFVVASPKFIFLVAILLLVFWPTETREDHPKPPLPDHHSGSSDVNLHRDFGNTRSVQEFHPSGKAEGTANE